MARRVSPIAVGANIARLQQPLNEETMAVTA
jgi:hypothetical protein